MVYWLLLFTIIVLTLLQYGLFYSFFHREKVTRWLDLPKHSTLPFIIFGVSTIVFFIILFFLLKQLSTPQPLTPGSISIPKGQGLPSGIQQLGHNDYTTQESYYYLYTNKDKSEDTLGAIAQQIKATECKKTCTINFYDTKKAYLLDQERLEITLDKTMEDWNQQNYVYVAEHYLGYLPYASNTSFTYYPYKDVYYRQRISK